MNSSKIKSSVFALFLAVLVLAAGCPKKEKNDKIPFEVKAISVSALSGGETTTFLGTGFGQQKGVVKIGETPLQIIKWKENLVRVRVPRLAAGNHNVDIELPNGFKAMAGVIALREPVDEKMNAWLGKDQINGAALEPLVLMFKPAAMPKTGPFDLNSNMPKRLDAYADEIGWACSMGVQMLQLVFPSNGATTEKDFPDTTMDNIRTVMEKVKRYCPDAIVEFEYKGMPEGNRFLTSKFPVSGFKTYPNIGRYKFKSDIKMKLTPITLPDDLLKTFTSSANEGIAPIPVVMTTWQAFDIKNLWNKPALKALPHVFQIRMALDEKAIDDQDTYKNIRSMLPENSKFFAAVTPDHISEIMGYAVGTGDHLSFGYGYALHWPGGSQDYIQGNMFLLEKIIEASEKIKRPLASAKQAMGIVGAKPVTKFETAKIAVDAGASRSKPPTSAITAVSSDRTGRDVWMGTDKGVYYTEDGGGSYKGLSKLSASTVTSIAPAADGSMWLATIGEGIYKISGKNGAVARYTAKPGELSGDNITCLYSYGNEIYSCAFGSDAEHKGGGIAYSTDGGKKWEVWDTTKKLPSNDIHTVYVEDEWVYAGFGGYSGAGASEGMAISPDFGQTWYKVQGISEPVYSIRVGCDGTLFVGTKGGGLYTAKYDGSQPKKLSTVPSNATVNSMQIDNRGWLWVVTDSAIMVTNDNGKTFKTFTVKDKVSSTLISDGTERTPGEMWFSGRPGNTNYPGGVTIFTVK